MAAGDIPLYYEGSWSILSTIGLINILFGLMVAGITNYSPITLVPIVVSIAGAIANGLCYYTLYEHHSVNATTLGGIFADLFWLIQEAGLSFYSYMILRRVLRGSPRTLFLILFWILITIISTFRLGILICRARNTIHGDLKLQRFVAHFHIGYFISIALVEILSSIFLLRIFAAAKKGSAEIASQGGLFQYLTKSTEVRLATLALIGITRAVTYSFQRTTKASDVTGQIDRFVFTLECLFPVVMYIDILASRIATANHSAASNSANGPANSRTTRSRIDKDLKMYSLGRSKSRPSPVSSSQECIVEEMGVKSTVGTRNSACGSGSGGVSGDVDRERERVQKGAISKTVEVRFEREGV